MCFPKEGSDPRNILKWLFSNWVANLLIKKKFFIFIFQWKRFSPFVAQIPQISLMLLLLTKPENTNWTSPWYDLWIYTIYNQEALSALFSHHTCYLCITKAYESIQWGLNIMTDILFCKHSWNAKVSNICLLRALCGVSKVCSQLKITIL